jgi:hypothetical protein
MKAIEATAGIHGERFTPRMRGAANLGTLTAYISTREVSNFFKLR